MAFFRKLFGNFFDELSNAVIRPHRDDYTIADLGMDKFQMKGRNYKRTDFSLHNKNNLRLQCSFWEPFDEERESDKMPCVIYLHGNSSSRCEAVNEAKYLLVTNICLFAFDFAGCGLSDGEYISLGWYEKDDVRCIVDYLKKTNKISTIGIWGRSMGSVTALMYCDKDPSISAVVIDSPFSSLNTLIKELAHKNVALPNFLINQTLKIVKDTTLSKAQFDIDDIEIIRYAKRLYVPALFTYGKLDDFVLPRHCIELYEAYAGKKKLLEINGDHNSIRPKYFKQATALFFHQNLGSIPQSCKSPPIFFPKKYYTASKIKSRNNDDHEMIDSLTEAKPTIITPLFKAKFQNLSTSVKPSICDTSVVCIEDDI